MKYYSVQVRFTHGGRFVGMGQFRATSHTNAIQQATKILVFNGEDAVEIAATCTTVEE
jgi:hypothetical protein